MGHLIIFILTFVFALLTTKHLYNTIKKPSLLDYMLGYHKPNLFSAFSTAFVIDFIWLLIVGITNFGWQPLLILTIGYLIENFNISVTTAYTIKYNKVPFKFWVITEIIGNGFELLGCIAMIPVLKMYIIN